MNKNRIAIYSRKSKFTGKGDSVENQVNLCKKYIENELNKDDIIYSTEDILLFEDEGFSGGNTNRPMFKKMMQEVTKRNIQIVLVYRLDRISRSIADFFQLLEQLEKYNVKFISVTEKFGSSPMATAMMGVTSVFSQFEREVIAERIRDNMLELSKTGRWLGGNTPLGFQSQESSHTDHMGKIRKSYKLITVNHEIATVKLIYDKFLELNSLTQLETYLINSNIKTRNNKNYSRFAIRNILNNPVYAVADIKLINYFEGLGCQIYNPQPDYDHQYGIMAYNRTKQIKGRSTKLRDYSEWIIAIGQHQGIISSDNWIKVQNMINTNKDKTFRKVKSTSALLSGLLICKNCGSYMRPKNGRINKEGKQSFYYVCELKEKSNGEKCNMNNLNGLKVDEMVIEQIKQMQSTNSALLTKLAQDKKKLNAAEDTQLAEKEHLQHLTAKNKKEIDNYIKKLSLIDDDDITAMVISNVKKLKEENEEIENKLSELNQHVHLTLANDTTLNYIAQKLASFGDEIESFEVTQQRSYLGTIIEKMEWDGNNVEIYLFGPNSQKRMSKMFPECVDSK